MNKITCIICPRSCEITRDEITNEIKGYSCLRGKNYAEQEFFQPKRSITSFIRTKNNTIYSVKTSKPIDKKLIFDLMKIIDETHPDKEFAIGDVVIKNVLGTDVDIVITKGENK